MAEILVVNRDIDSTFSNAQTGDLAIYTNSNANVVHIGCEPSPNSNATVIVSKSNVTVYGDINFTGQLTQNNAIFKSGGGTVAGLSNVPGAVFVQEGSNLGIGTSTPTALLHVAGDTRIDGDITLGNRALNLSQVKISYRTAPIQGAANITSAITSIPGYNPQNASNVTFTLSNAQTQFQFNAPTGTPIATLSTTGVDVPGNINFSGNLTQNGTPFQSGTPGISTSGDNIYINPNSNLGIGLSTPKTALHILSNNPPGTEAVLATFTATGGLAGSKACIDINTFNTPYPQSRISAIDDAAYSAHLAFSAKDPGVDANALIERMRIQSNGFVGIGTENPATTLDIAGSIATGGTTRVALDGGLSNVRINATSIVAGTIGTEFLPTATTTASGVVQLSNSISSTSSTVAASSTAVKTSYDLANDALPKAGGVMIGQIQGSATDTVSTPGYSWSGDANTGIYHVNNGVIGFSAGGVQVASMGNSGLDVVGAFATGGVTRIGVNGDLSNVSIPSSASTVTIDASRVTTGTLAVANGGTGTTTSTGTGSVVLNTNPTFTGTLTAANINFSGNLLKNGSLFSGGGGGTLTVDTSDALTISGASNVSILLNTQQTSGTAQWGVSIDGTGTETGYAVAVDASGNVYIAGGYDTAAATIFNANNIISSVTLRAPTDNAGFVVKYDSSGTALWAASVDGGGFDKINSVAVDSSGNVYIGGLYSTSGATIYSANNVASSITLRSTSGSYAACVVKYNSTGTALWAVSVDSPGSDVGEGLCVDSSGNVYFAVIIDTTSTSTIYNANNTASGVTLRAPSGLYMACVVKYNSTGTALWAVSVDGGGYDHSYGVAADTNGNVYMCGMYGYLGGAATIYNANNNASPLPALRAANNTYAGFVVKYDSSGTALWAASVDGSGNDIVNGVVVDSNGNVYLTGVYSSTGATIYNTNNNASSLTLRATTASSAAYAIKYNSSGTALWAVSVDGSGNEMGNSIAVDSNGNIYISGPYDTSASTVYNANNVASSVTLRAPSGGGAFVVKYDSAGMAQWAVSVDGSSNDQAYGMAVDSSGNLYMAGVYYGTSTIYNGNNVASTLSFRTSTAGSAFIVKYTNSVLAQYKILSNSSTFTSGQYKLLLNVNNATAATLNIRNANDSTTLNTITVPPNGTKYLLFYNGNWYVIV